MVIRRAGCGSGSRKARVREQPIAALGRRRASRKVGDTWGVGGRKGVRGGQWRGRGCGMV